MATSPKTLHRQTVFSPPRGCHAQRSNFALFFVGIVLIASLFGTFLSGQEYRVEPVDETLADRKAAILSSGDSGTIQDFLQKYYLARWTTPDNAQKLHTFRREINTDAAALPAEKKNQLLSTLATYAANPSYTPAVRYNAVLAIGGLNESDAGVVPFAGAIPVLAELFAEEKKMPDYVLLGCLNGLFRHASHGISDEANRERVARIFVETLDPSFDRKRGIDPSVAVWLGIRGVMGLAIFNTPGIGTNDTMILDTFRRLIEEPKTDPQIQSLAARSLGKLDFSGLKVQEYDTAGLARSVARLLYGLMSKEIDSIDNEGLRGQISTGQSLGTGTRGGGGMMGEGSGPGMRPNRGNNPGMGPGAGNTGGDTSELESVLGQIKYDLESIQWGIRGTNGQGGVLSILPAEDTDTRALLESSVLSEIDQLNHFLDYGAVALERNFDPKAYAKLFQQQFRNQKVFMVTVSQIRDFLSEQVLKYRAILPEK